MKSIVFLIVMLTITIVSLLQIEPDTTHVWAPVAAAAAAVATWMIGCIFVSISNHMENLATVASSIGRIAAAENRLKDARGLSNDGHGLPDSLLALQQENSPLVTYMGIVNQALREVEVEYDRKAEATGKITSRKVGPFGFVVTMFGDMS